jgi:DeoR family transcriptional regulator of aga operon
VVGLNGGTTTTEVARALAVRADLQSDALESSVTIVTNALNIAHELAVRSHVKLVVLGGVARSQSYELIGPLSLPVLAQLSLDVAIIGVDAFDVDLGASAHNEAEADVNGRIAGRAARVIVVADSSKLGRSAFAQIVPLDRVDTLVTDSDADPALIAAMRAAGLEVTQA